MSIELIIQISTLLSILFGITAFFWGINSYQRQMYAQVFIEYTKRFEEIMQSFSRNAWMARLNSDGALPEPSEELSISVIRNFAPMSTSCTTVLPLLDNSVREAP